MGEGWVISAFGDEIADDLDDQLHWLQAAGVAYLEVRNVWGKNVLRLSNDEAGRIRREAERHGVAIGGIGSPVGKSPITDPIELETANLARAFQLAEILGTRSIRVFSFYPPDLQTTQRDGYVELAAARLAQLTDMAAREGFSLLLENELHLIGDVPERCHAIITAVGSPHLRFVWDPANFVASGVLNPTGRAWPLLGAHVACVHVKDFQRSGQRVVTAGAGDGEWPELLVHLHRTGYSGGFALEPHLLVAGHSAGYSGPEGMDRALAALRRLLDQAGYAGAGGRSTA